MPIPDPSPQLRARDLMAMFADPGIHAIQCLRGGYGSAQVAPLLDYQAIARHPKPLIGFSDITALHAALLKFSGLVTFYGPSLTQAATSGATNLSQRLHISGEMRTFCSSGPRSTIARTSAADLWRPSAMPRISCS